MIKIIIAVLLVGVIISLFAGLFFLVNDDAKSKRVVYSLAVRVSLAALILIIVAIALYTGDLKLNPSPV